MKTLTSPFALEVATFAGMLTGIGLLVAGLLVQELRILGAPGLLLVLPSLIAGMR